MDKELYEYVEISDLKDMLNKTKKIYEDKTAYKLRGEKPGTFNIVTHKEVREMVDALGTSLINMGLKGKRIAVIGENRYEWEIAYLAVVCGTGIVAPMDKSLPENELKNLIERSGVEAIIYSGKYEEEIKRIKEEGIGKLKYFISMDLKEESDGIYSELELIENGKKLIANGDRAFIDAKIDVEEMNIMLFTSGTTAKSKIVALSHKNLVSNLMSTSSVLDINSNDTILSFLPLHHVYECTVGFLLSLYKGAQTTFCDGIRHILENVNEYQVTVMSCVPAIYENIYKNIMKKIEKEGKTNQINLLVEKYKNASMEEKRMVFKEIHEVFGGRMKLMLSGAAALNKEVAEGFFNFGINLAQGYGLTETSPVLTVETNKYRKAGSVGKTIPHVEAKIIDINKEGIGELVVKGPNIMLGYYEDEKATNEVLKDGWFYTGDLATIDDEGYIFICGRKKNVIVLKNGKNIFPEEMECLVNKIEGVKESFVYGKAKDTDKDDIRINVKIVYDEEMVKNVYGVKTDKEIYDSIYEQIKKINKTMPPYKAIRGMILTENPLIKTTTSKIKRQEEIKTIAS